MVGKALLILFLAFAAYIGFNFYSILEINKSIPLLSNNGCVRHGISSKGPEDITYFNEEYLITASSNMVEIWYHFDDQANINSGDIILIPSNGRDDLVFLTKENLPANYKLHAHGIYVKGNLLYILNHGYKYGGERLDIFSIDAVNKKATFQKSFIFPDELFGITNDIIALNDDDFFVTSWNAFTHDITGPNKFKHLLGIFIQGALRYKMTYVFHCSFSTGKCRKLPNTEGIINNGITWNHDESNPVAYVVDTIRKVREYKIVKDSNGEYQFVLTKTFDIDYLMDNIEYSPKENRLYIALIGRGVEYFKFVGYLEKHKKLPEYSEMTYHSGAGYIDLSTGEFKELRFTTMIKGGASALLVNGKYFFGSYGDNAVVVCSQ